MNKEEICDFVGRWNIEPAEDLDSYVRGNLYNFILDQSQESQPSLVADRNAIFPPFCKLNIGS